MVKCRNRADGIPHALLCVWTCDAITSQVECMSSHSRVGALCWGYWHCDLGGKVQDNRPETRIVVIQDGGLRKTRR